MLVKNREIDIEHEKTLACFFENNLVVYNLGCFVARADSMKLFYLLKDKIKKPTLILLICNVTDAATTCARKNIIELKEKYPNYKVFITGCINESVESKFKKLGEIVYKKDMWDIKSYE